MAENVFVSTKRYMEGLAAKNKSILVAFSGGKDSLCVLDLCCRYIENVTCFFMYFVPNLSLIEQQLQFARDRYKVNILQYPHWAVFRALKFGAYCPGHYKRILWPEIRLQHIQDLARADAGIRTVAHGGKRSDSLWRRRSFKSHKLSEMVFPIKEWNRWDVLAYLKLQNIPVPDSESRDNTGIGLSARGLLWLHDKYPEDFERMRHWFPYVPAIVARRKFWPELGLPYYDNGKKEDDHTETTASSS